MQMNEQKQDIFSNCESPLGNKNNHQICFLKSVISKRIIPPKFHHAS